MSSLKSTHECMGTIHASRSSFLMRAISRALMWMATCFACAGWAASPADEKMETPVVASNTPAIDSSEGDGLLADQLSVRELMRWETSQALKRLRADRESLSAGTERHTHRAAPDLNAASLIAIYGVGRKLMAEVRIDGASLLFMRGRTNAVGPGKSHRMRLLSLTERCVEIAIGDQQRVLCANAQLPTGG